MVQVLPPKTNVGTDIGKSLGGGIGNFLGDYFANKSLDKVLNDPALKDAPLSERWSAIERSLAQHGERGQKLLMNRMAVEQQGEQEKQKKTQEKQLKLAQGVLGRVLNGEQVSDEEMQLLPLDIQVKAKKALQQKAPPGGLSGQPVPPEVAQAIPNILNANKNASADDLAVAFDSANIPRAYSNSYIENRRRQDETLAKTSIESKKYGYETNKDYLNKAFEGQRAADEMDLKLDEIARINKQGDLPSPVMASTLEGLGIPVAIFSSDAEALEKLSVDLTKNIQQFYGSRILQTEFQTFLKSLPSLKNSTEGRERIIQNMKRFNDLKRIEGEKVAEIAEQYEQEGKPLPHNFRNKVWEAMKPEIDRTAKEFEQRAAQKSESTVMMRSPSGKTVSVPQSKVAEAEANGGQRI